MEVCTSSAGTSSIYTLAIPVVKVKTLFNSRRARLLEDKIAQVDDFK
jgi:hypothetical protein